MKNLVLLDICKIVLNEGFSNITADMWKIPAERFPELLETLVLSKFKPKLDGNDLGDRGVGYIASGSPNLKKLWICTKVLIGSDEWSI